MTFDFFEGPAGTGKTHSLVGRAEELAGDRALGDGQKVLALTFMNGARRRLEARLSANSVFRRRFDCLTFDVFARTLAARRRSLISAPFREHAARLNAFDGPCFLAASLLESQVIGKWIARSYPLVVVDEAQDLDDHRLRILQGLSATCSTVAAADAFQCLTDGRDTSFLLGWLESAGKTHRLTQPRRTTKHGLLVAALAVREDRDIRVLLNHSQQARNPTWYGAGFRLVQVHARNAGLVAWAIANEMSQRNGQTAILTPDAQNTLLRAALDTVYTRVWTRSSGRTFGPYPHTWDRSDTEEVDALLARIMLPQSATFDDLRVILTPFATNVPIAQAIGRMDRLRRVQGQVRFSSAQVTDFVYESSRNQFRLGLRQHRGHLAMTIQRAKNREFPNVIVLWPHSVMGSAEHMRRLLYNAITRAMAHCTVIVFGEGRLRGPPFAPI